MCKDNTRYKPYYHAQNIAIYVTIGSNCMIRRSLMQGVDVLKRQELGVMAQIVFFEYSRTRTGKGLL